MRKYIFSLVLLFAGFSSVNAQEVDYEALEKSINERPTPAWLKEAKLGYF